MSRFDKVIEILDRSVGGAGSHVGVHGPFWRGKTRDQFVTEQVFGRPLVVVGNGADSNLVKALKGEAPFGTDLGTSGATFRRMPAGLAPVSAQDIAFLEQWIDDGCPAVDEDSPGQELNLREIRLLPPMAIARLGSSPDPMDNYDLEDPQDPAGFRSVVPAETLMVEDGQVRSAQVPAAVEFRDPDGRIRPVAPFLEVWASFSEDGPLEPLTVDHLKALGGSSQSVRWTVRVGNLKAFRRTGSPADRITAQAVGFNDHGVKALQGRAANFHADRSIPLGSVQYLEPNEEFPQIRLRFTPAAGGVYGHRRDFPELNVVYNPNRGEWDDHEDSQPPTSSPTPRARVATAPANIYARSQLPGPGRGRNLGYLDDTCDGIVEVRVEVAGASHSARARISSGPPDFAPDSLHVRTVADDLEQMALGPRVDEPMAEDELARKVIDTVTRAMETMRLADTARLNVLYGGPFPGNRAAFSTARATHQELRRSLAGLHAAPGSPQREAAVNQLRRILTFLRTYDAAADFSPAGTRRMPALMRGADAGHLALTRRQRNLVARAIEVFAGAAAETPRDAMLRLVAVLGPGVAFLHTSFALDAGPPLSERFADPPQALEYLLQADARGGVATGLGLAGEPLVVAGRPDDSALVRLVSHPQHPMNGPFSNYVDEASGANGIEVVRSWIESLATSPGEPIT